tara:strand:- start:908 stop:1621 length:714 start_codon:yes stop_codon:yes gene_type:complete
MMMLHCGGRSVSFAELQGVPLPEETETYTPVAFADLITNAQEVASDLLTDYAFRDAQYALAAKDQRMFAILNFAGDDPEMNLSLGIRSSYDKSMSNGYCFGGSITVCDNLLFAGDFVIMRKHTKNVFDDLRKQLIGTIYDFKKESKFQNIVRDRDDMKKVSINTDDAYQFLGRMFGYGVIKARQLTTAVNCWKNPPYAEFKEKNMWSLYNACTEALKSTPPNKIIQQHIKLHEYATA